MTQGPSEHRESAGDLDDVSCKSLRVGNSVEVVSRIRLFADETFVALGFRQAEKRDVPPNTRFYIHPEMGCAAMLLDSLTGMRAGGCVASAVRVFHESKLWPAIALTAPTQETLSSALLPNVANEEVEGHIERLLQYSTRIAVQEAIQHEFSHIKDMLVGTFYMRILEQACLFDLGQMGLLPPKFVPQTRPDAALEQACRLLSEIPAYAQQPVSAPETFCAATRCINAIKNAMQGPEKDRDYAVFKALGDWRDGVPAGYEVGEEEALLIATQIVLKDPDSIIRDL
jgi:hypothetical protein